MRKKAIKSKHAVLHVNQQHPGVLTLMYSNTEGSRGVICAVQKICNNLFSTHPPDMVKVYLNDKEGCRKASTQLQGNQQHPGVITIIIFKYRK
eukprot:1156286-Pelagomonas_calceolata.AAC.2